MTHDHEPHPDHEHEHDHSHAGGLKGFVLSIFKPHSHDAADSIDSALEASAEGVRALKISLLALGATAVAQLAVVLVTGSVALLADTIHNFSDALTAVPLWIAFVLGRRAANDRYTYGYGRAEDLAGIFIVLMIAASAVVAGYESISRLIDPSPLARPWVVVAAGVVGFLGNELVATYRIRVGRHIGSAALVADGVHARTDGFTPSPWWAARSVSWQGSRSPTRSSDSSSRWRSSLCCAAPRLTSTAASWTRSTPG